jgi:mRNA interferase MazF
MSTTSAARRSLGPGKAHSWLHLGDRRLAQRVKRGDVVTVAAKGHYSGKPSPALVFQSDLFSALGMIDKIVTVPRETIGSRMGALDHELMVRVDRSLAVFLGIV